MIQIDTLTKEDRIKLAEDIDNAFDAMCESYNCCDCAYSKTDGYCYPLFVMDYLARNGDKPQKNADVRGDFGENGEKHPLTCKKTAHIGEDINVPTTESATYTNVGTHLPKWCKVGAWVEDKQGNICKITRLAYTHKAVRVSIPKDGGRSIYFEGRLLEDIVPVKFRPYSYGEAKGLLGKTMEYTVKNACSSVHHSMLICKVSSNDNNGDAFIHSCRFSDWVDYEATIDSVPIGIAEVDTEAMKEDSENE